MGASRIAIHIDETLLTRLVRECRKLDRQFEQALAEEGLGAEEWPGY